MALTVDESNKEVTVMGKGLAFGKKFGDDIAEDILEKTLY
ncbi:CAT RNA binding domain-containing protein [Globicatella sulfidifaciens]